MGPVSADGASPPPAAGPAPGGPANCASNHPLSGSLPARFSRVDGGVCP